MFRAKITTVQHFVKANLPPPRSFYQREFEKLGRERRSWVQVKCCFHDGQSPTSLALNLETGGFFCFRCGTKGGDIVAFLRLRYGFTFKQACIELGAWSEDGAVSPAHVRNLEREHHQQQREKQTQIETDRNRRIAARDWLHVVERIDGRVGDRLSVIQRGAREKFQGELELCWQILADTLPQLREAEERYFQIAGLNHAG